MTIKEPKNIHHFMVDCLAEEILKSPLKFNDKTIAFIRSLCAHFFNDPEFKLTPGQITWLEDIWRK